MAWSTIAFHRGAIGHGRNPTIYVPELMAHRGCKCNRGGPHWTGMLAASVANSIGAERREDIVPKQALKKDMAQGPQHFILGRETFVAVHTYCLLCN